MDESDGRATGADDLHYHGLTVTAHTHLGAPQQVFVGEGGS